MVLVDTTVWVDFFANRSNAHVEMLTDLIEAEQDSFISGVIFAEVLKGFLQTTHTRLNVRITER